MSHACLHCASSDDFQKPISMTTENHLHMSFSCHNPCIRDAYGQLGKDNAMIIDLVTGICWVDGSSHVPSTGCENYLRNKLVNEEVTCDRTGDIPADCIPVPMQDLTYGDCARFSISVDLVRNLLPENAGGMANTTKEQA